jgi:hypothetical protein
VGHRVTAVDTTQEGYLYVVVDFGEGWVEDFIFPGLTAENGLPIVAAQVIAEHEVRGRLLYFHGNRCDPNIRRAS